MSLLAAGGLEVIVRADTAWIPVETTVLREGFVASWKAASALVRAHRGADFEFLPVRSLRERWRPLPVRTSTIAAAAPTAAVLDARVEASLAGIEKLAYAPRLAELEAAAKGLSGRKELQVRMRQGILHALFGKLADAEKVFRAAQAKDPAMASPWVNLANLQMAGGDIDGAIATLRDGMKKVEDASRLTLALARCYSAKGDRKNAELYLAETRKTSPQLAVRGSGGGFVGSWRAGGWIGAAPLVDGRLARVAGTGGVGAAASAPRVSRYFFAFFAGFFAVFLATFFLAVFFATFFAGFFATFFFFAAALAMLPSSECVRTRGQSAELHPSITHQRPVAYRGVRIFSPPASHGLPTCDPAHQPAVRQAARSAGQVRDTPRPAVDRAARPAQC